MTPKPLLRGSGFGVLLSCFVSSAISTTSPPDNDASENESSLAGLHFSMVLLTLVVVAWMVFNSQRVLKLFEPRDEHLPDPGKHVTSWEGYLDSKNVSFDPFGLIIINSFAQPSANMIVFKRNNHNSLLVGIAGAGIISLIYLIALAAASSGTFTAIWPFFLCCLLATLLRVEWIVTIDSARKFITTQTKRGLFGCIGRERAYSMSEFVGIKMFAGAFKRFSLTLDHRDHTIPVVFCNFIDCIEYYDRLHYFLFGRDRDDIKDSGANDYEVELDEEVV